MQTSSAVMTGSKAASDGTIAVAGVSDRSVPRQPQMKHSSTSNFNVLMHVSTHTMCCSGSVEVLKLNLATGNIVDQASYKAPRSSRLHSVVLRQDIMAAITSDGQQLCIASLLGRFQLFIGTPYRLSSVLMPFTTRHLTAVYAFVSSAIATFSMGNSCSLVLGLS